MKATALTILLLAACATRAADDDPAAQLQAAASSGVGGTSSTTTGGPGTGGTGNTAVQGDPFDVAALEAAVSYLASDAMKGRAPGTPEDDEAQQYVEQRFTELGLTPGMPNGYRQTFVNEQGDATANVVGYVPGTDKASEIIMVGGHFDHLGVISGEIYNGANDNASGTAGMLAVAQALRQRDTPPRRTVVFIAFGSEETGLEGSYYYAYNPPPDLPTNDMVYMLNLDMIGTLTQQGSVRAYGSFAGTPGRAILDELLMAHPDLLVEKGIEGEGESDYDAFCIEGIPYAYFETFDEECYHSPCDDADRIDYQGLSLLSKMMFDILTALADRDTDLIAAKASLGCKKVDD